jgi:hypothetical protein
MFWVALTLAGPDLVTLRSAVGPTVEVAEDASFSLFGSF